MDITPATTPTTKTPEPTETDTPTRAINPSNGVLKRHAPLTHLHHHHPIVITYKECLKNHAAALGTHAVDGCGEFMPSSTSNPSDPTSLKCAACGCHRNFHRRDPDETPPQLLLPPPPLITDYTPHHRHRPPPPQAEAESPTNSPSPPPISSAYAPHMLLALSHAGGGPGGQPPELPTPTPNSHTTHIQQHHQQMFSNSNSRKRFRTKFTQEQKEKMLELAEKVGWKMQKKDEDTINDHCAKIGVDKSVFKVWMHNNKNTVGRKDQTTPPPSSTTTTTNNNHSNPAGNGTYSIGYLQEGNKDNFHDSNGNTNGRALHHHQVNHHHNLGTNGSSTSS